MQYENHPNRIARDSEPDTESPTGLKPENPIIQQIKHGHEIVYYATTDRVVVGIFKVVSDCKLINERARLDNKYDWKNVFSLRIKPEDGYVARPPYYVYYGDIKEELKGKLKKFFKYPVKRRGVATRLDGKDFKEIKRFVKRYIQKGHDTQPLNLTPKEKRKPNDVENEDVQKIRRSRFMTYAPIAEDGVVALFVHFMRELGFRKLEFIRKEFPDACAVDRHGGEKYIEFELRSSGFAKDHLRNPKHNIIRCDFVVCWKHDCRTIEKDVDVIELSSKLGLID